MLARHTSRARLVSCAAAFIALAGDVRPVAAEAGAAIPSAYIPAGSELSYTVVRAPLPAHRIGAIAVAALAALRDPAAVMPAVLGDAALHAAPPPGWPAEAPGGARGAAPFAARGQGACACATEIGDTSHERIAVLYASRAFTVGPELDRLRVLRLRARYEDGLVAYINGREVARRGIPRQGALLDTATVPHGPEWETFHITVVPGLLRSGTNVLSVEVRPSAQRLAPRLDVELLAADGPRIVRGPMIQRVGRTSATVVFETDLPVAGAVEYGPAGAASRVVRSAGGGLAVRHVVELVDLPGGQPVRYRVRAQDGSTQGAAPAELDELRFHTAPAAGEVIRFVVYGDVRGGHRTHGALVGAILKEAPDLVLVTGDLVLRGSDEGDWQRFFEVVAELIARVPYYPVAGNHDVGQSGDQRRRMNEIFELWHGPEDRPAWGHWYSFAVGDLHFVMLDSNAYEREEQLTWLERDLAAARARGVRAIFAMAHDGPYSRGLHQGNAYAAQHYVPVLQRHGVTLMFSGHDHLYQRGQIGGFAYIVSGGGGAPLYPVRCGIPGKRRCRAPDGMQHVTSEHHYVMVSVYSSHAEVCPRRVDGTPLEACITYRLR